MTREIQKSDLEALLDLYLSLHETSIPEDTPALRKVWENILQDANHHVIVCEENGIRTSELLFRERIRDPQTRQAFEAVVEAYIEYRKEGPFRVIDIRYAVLGFLREQTGCSASMTS